MEFVVAQIVGAVHIPKPGELQKMRGDAVSKVDELEASVLGCCLPGYGKSQGFLVKIQRFFQIIYVDIVVIK